MISGLCMAARYMAYEFRHLAPGFGFVLSVRVWSLILHSIQDLFSVYAFMLWHLAFSCC